MATTALLPSDLPQPAYNATNLQLLRMLALAVVVGVLDAFAVLAFRWLLVVAEAGLYGSKQGLVADAAGLSSFFLPLADSWQGSSWSTLQGAAKVGEAPTIWRR
ncbi:MAG: hypothetical protein ACUVQV_07055 [Dissulfurimicrobium sp.]|uniref:hypothetical protein n=1 Tax=Dissulfurimicrobium sp. TaxID=2022436 RepID=UPI00404A4883